MEAILLYAILSSICLAVFYAFYVLILQKTYAFQTIRYFLVISILVSVFLPFQKYELNIIPVRPVQKMVIQLPQTNELQTVNKNHIINKPLDNQQTIEQSNKIGVLSIITTLYLSIALLLFIILVRDIIRVFRLKYFSNKESYHNITFYHSEKVKSPFSFFSWIFINSSIITEESNNIVLHEKVHTDQFHTLDILIAELLKIVFWFNPIVWFLSKAIKQNHEFIADKGVIDTGINKIEYQTLLINQIAEEKLLTLSSGFNHSLIKKRIVMMTKNKFKQKIGLRLLTVVPIAAILFLGISCVNGQKKQNSIEPVATVAPTKIKQNSEKPLAVVAPTKMNVLYLGVDNPVSIAVSEYKTDEIKVSVTNGKIRGENGNYIVNPIRPGNCYISVYAKDETVGGYEFRVKRVPDPQAALGDHLSGPIKKEVMEQYKGLNATMKNFDFDLRFRIVSFVMSTTVPSTHTVVEEISNSSEFTKKQLNLINGLVKNQKVYFEQIKAIGPDGATRGLPPLVFTIE